jgi:cephalosporin hydroxylase
MVLKEVIEYTKINEEISWNNPKLLDGLNEEYYKYLTNYDFPGKGRVCGYFTLIHNLVKELPNDAIIVELGNREGMSTLAIYDALKPKQKFYTIDIIKDLRVLPKEFFNDERVNVIYGDCTDNKIVSLLNDESIDFLFSDTIHYHEQVDKELKAYKRKLKNNAIVYVDDIRLNNKGQFFTEWEGEKYDLGVWAHESGFGCFKYEF